MEEEQLEQQKPVELQFLGSLELLQTVKNSQSQNGLKHDDYNRYRRYCTKKIQKIRKGLKFKLRTNNNKKFLKKNILEEHPNDPKILQVLLYQIEHDWSYAMDIRQDMDSKPEDTGNRMKFHVAKKILKAYRNAQQLSQVCRDRTEKVTGQEAEAYECFMGGFYYHEKERWNEALTQYIKSRQIYSELVKISDSLKNALFTEKIEQLDQSIRFVYQRTGGSMLDSVEVILGKFKNDHIQVAQSNNEQNNKQKVNKGFLEIDFHNEKFPIKNQKVIQLYQEVENLQAQLADLLKKQSQDNNNIENILNGFLDLFQNYDDIIRLINKDKEDPKNSEAEKEIYNSVLLCFQAKKFEQMIQRNQLHIRIALAKFENEKGITNLQELMTKKAFKLRLTRPAEIVKLCDNYIQIMKQLMEIERHNPNLQNFRQLDGQMIYYKSVRCYYVSLIYYSNEKLIETLSLLQSAESYLDYAQNSFQQEKSEVILENEVQNFQTQLDNFKVRAKIAYLEKNSQQQQDTTDLDKKIQNLNINESKLQSELSIANMIQDSFDGKKFDIDIQKLSHCTIDDIPPKPQISGCKPIFFDLAHQNLVYPDVSGKIKEEKQGGFFNKFKIWGKK